SFAKILMEPPACSNDAQKNIIKEAMIMTANILCLVILLYRNVRVTNKTTNEIKAREIAKLEKSVPPISNMFVLEILETGSLITQVKPKTATIPINILSISVKGFFLS